MLKKLLSMALAAIMVMGMGTTAFAAEKTTPPAEGNTLISTPVLTESQKNLLNDWVSYDDGTKQFSIKQNAETALTNTDYLLLENCILITNQNIEKADFSSNEIYVVSPENEGVKTSTRAFSEGVTKIEFHWWGATIYLSKSTINVIGSGVAIGGIWVPEPLVSKILSTLGVIVALCPGGIAFDYNYIAAGISALVPGTALFFSAVSNTRWQ